MHIFNFYRENGNLAICTAPPAGLIQDYITLIACPVPFHQTTHLSNLLLGYSSFLLTSFDVLFGASAITNIPKLVS